MKIDDRRGSLVDVNFSFCSEQKSDISGRREIFLMVNANKTEYKRTKMFISDKKCFLVHNPPLTRYKLGGLSPAPMTLQEMKLV